MMLALTFATPLLLVGMLAALIPLVLHLLARSRAQEVLFPTLRFLRTSMEKTARRRRVQHVLLMVLRMLLLALLALAVSEPMTAALGDWLGGANYAAVVVLDNSLSMGALNGAQTRLDRAKDEIVNLLSGEQKPSMSALLTTNGGFVSREISADLAPLRDAVKPTRLGGGVAHLDQQIDAAVAMLKKTSIAQKSVYLFSDLQLLSFKDLVGLKSLVDANSVHLMVVNVGTPQVDNVGISDVKISGHRLVDQMLQITASLTNSSPTDKVVEVSLHVNGASIGQKVRTSLAAAGEDGCTRDVRFFHAFKQQGMATGEVVIEQSDDLIKDHVRHFALHIGGRVRVLIVPGPGDVQEPMMEPAAMLDLALSPYREKDAPWSIVSQTVPCDRFSLSSLQNVDAVFFCDVPAFTKEQAELVKSFVLSGGTAAFFLGPNVKAASYNEVFSPSQAGSQEGSLLPATIGAAVGDVGPTAQASPIDWVDIAHPFFNGLYENLKEYTDLGLLVQRYYKFPVIGAGAHQLLRLKVGDPVLLVKNFQGKGSVVLCATTASPVWNNLSVKAIFLPMVSRICLLSRPQTGHDDIYLAGSQVEIRPDSVPGDVKGQLSVVVTLPEEDEPNAAVISVPLKRTVNDCLADFTETWRLGIYSWRVAGAGDREITGSFAVNFDGAETQLVTYGMGKPSEPRRWLKDHSGGQLADYVAQRFQEDMAYSGISQVYVGPTVKAVNEAAAAASEGDNLWDRVMAVVVVLLVIEAVVANRFKKSAGETVGRLAPA